MPIMFPVTARAIHNQPCSLKDVPMLKGYRHYCQLERQSARLIACLGRLRSRRMDLVCKGLQVVVTRIYVDVRVRQKEVDTLKS